MHLPEVLIDSRRLGLGRELWAVAWGEGGDTRVGGRERVDAGEGERKER